MRWLPRHHTQRAAPGGSARWSPSAPWAPSSPLGDQASSPHVAMLAGQLTFVQDWAHATTDSGADVTLLRRGPVRGGFSYRPASGCEVASAVYPVLSLRPSRVFRRLNGWVLAASLRRVIRLTEAGSRAVTHLHTHFYPGSDVASRVAQDLGIALIHTEHSSAIVTGHVSELGRRALLETCERASTVFAVGEELAQAMETLGVMRPIRVVPNPVNVDLFAATPLLADYPPPSGAWHFVTIGWLVPRKNHACVLEAFGRVQAQLPNSRLTVVGSGELLGELEALARALGLEGQVVFAGELERAAIASVLATGHCYVHASQAETFGVALVEAWAAGLPVVTFDCGGVASHAQEIGGRTVPGADAEDLAAAMLGEIRLASTERREHIRATAWERFDLQPVSRELREAYAGSVRCRP
jgi:glycosyltransferase involved in cell wall biosynthesis